MTKVSDFLTPILPLVESGELDYEHHDDLKEVIKQNFKNLLLTIPGERVMNADFGVGVQRFLFEQNSSFLAGNIESTVREQVSRYMPFISINEISANVDDNNLMNFNVIYTVPSLNVDESISFLFNEDGTLKS
jgi:uncharacterized protein